MSLKLNDNLSINGKKFKKTITDTVDFNIYQLPYSKHIYRYKKAVNLN